LILTLTVNPAIDRNVTVDRLVFDDRAYILDTNDTPGGRGLNASQVLASFGARTEAVLTAGGESGGRMREMLADSGFPVHLVDVASPTRVNMNITDKQGLTVKLNEKGAPLSADELKALEKAVHQRLPEARWMMLCGSLPPGAPDDLYARLIETARALGVKTILDTDGAPLMQGLEAHPTIVSPNQQEAERLLGRVLLTRAQMIEAAEQIRMMGAERVVLSLGSRGVMGSEDGRLVEAIPPRVDVVCPIGAGDALAASFVWAMRRGTDFAEALRWGVAAGTASAMLPGVTFASFDQTREIYEQVQVRESAR